MIPILPQKLVDKDREKILAGRDPATRVYIEEQIEEMERLYVYQYTIQVSGGMYIIRDGGILRFVQYDPYQPPECPV